MLDRVWRQAQCINIAVFKPFRKASNNVFSARRGVATRTGHYNCSSTTRPPFKSATARWRSRVVAASEPVFLSRQKTELIGLKDKIQPSLRKDQLHHLIISPIAFPHHASPTHPGRPILNLPRHGLFGFKRIDRQHHHIATHPRRPSSPMNPANPSPSPSSTPPIRPIRPIPSIIASQHLVSSSIADNTERLNHISDRARARVSRPWSRRGIVNAGSAYPAKYSPFADSSSILTLARPFRLLAATVSTGRWMDLRAAARGRWRRRLRTRGEPVAEEIEALWDLKVKGIYRGFLAAWYGVFERRRWRRRGETSVDW